MNLALIDWVIVAGLLGSLAAIALTVRRYTRSVADFLAGNRCAGRYLLTLSEGLTALGLAGTVANFEKFYQAGFAASWWGNMMMPIGLIIALSGWVNYRYRETRAMTMAQFFEMRYSRRFRIFAGLVAFGSGVLNFGIFPGIAARFLVYFCGFPTWTFPIVMALMIAATLTLTLTGGMVTVMITDFLQAQFINVVFLVVMFVLFSRFAWGDIATTLQASPPGRSLIDPFDQAGISDFNIWFFGIFAFKLIYNRLGWQGTQGFNCAARSPHEAKMANILAEWRGGVTYLIIMLMPICAYVLLHGAGGWPESEPIRSSLGQIADPQMQKQLTTPIALVHVLPKGVVGLLCAAMIAATIGNDSAYMHAWGSIFIQDVLLPLRGRPLTPQGHLKVLRVSVACVAAFAFCFSWLVPMRDYVIMFQLLTGAIYLAGSGSVIIGGLYWRRGTTQGAWSAMIVGMALALGGLLLRQFWGSLPFLHERFGPEFPMNGAWIALIASLAAMVAYVAASLLTCRQGFNMERLLHRGRYAIGRDHAPAGTSPTAAKRRWLGITDEFTASDRLIYFLKIGWTGFWFVTFIAGTLWGLGGVWGWWPRIAKSTWMNWWMFTVALGACVGAITVVWFLWGGIRDLFDLLRALRYAQRDLRDDGTVQHEPDLPAAASAGAPEIDSAEAAAVPS